MLAIRNPFSLALLVGLAGLVIYGFMKDFYSPVDKREAESILSHRLAITLFTVDSILTRSRRV